MTVTRKSRLAPEDQEPGQGSYVVHDPSILNLTNFDTVESPENQAVATPITGHENSQTAPRAALPVSPPPVTGKAKLDEQVRNRPVYAGDIDSHDYDQWVLSLRADTPDQQYNEALRQEQQAAKQREDKRTADYQAAHPEPLAPGERAALNMQNQATANAKGSKANAIADKRAKYEDATRGKPQNTVNQVIGLDGNPASPAGKSAPGAFGQAASQVAGGLAGAPAGSLGDVRDGEHVFIGPGGIGADTGKAALGNTLHNSKQFMSKDDAYNIPATWSPNAVAGFQKLTGLRVTGYVDQKTLAAWKDVVDTAAVLTAAGRDVDMRVIAVAEAQSKGHGGYSGSGGGGGGGGGHGGGGGGGSGGAGYSVSQVKGFLANVFQSEVGREPTDAEAQQFTAALNSAGGTVDPTQFAKDWIRSHVGGEAGSYQAATNYYDAMLSVLSGNYGGG